MQKVTFSKEFTNWPLHGREHLNLVYVETAGYTVEQMLENAWISLEDWHGNEGPEWGFEDLPAQDQKRLEEMFAERLQAVGA